MLSHYRSYVHAEGRVTVSVDSLPCPMQGMENRIMMWSLCRVCQESGPFIPMSEETWKYSFGKYLELTFYHEKQVPRTTSCTHDIHKEHCRFFAFRNKTLRFQFVVHQCTGFRKANLCLN
jgi:1-phosphatidylinositol-3-phosphate 5-kinase